MATGKIYPDVQIEKHKDVSQFPGIARCFVNIGTGIQIVRFYGTTTAQINAWSYTSWPMPTVNSQCFPLHLDDGFYIETTSSNYRNLKVNKNIPSGTTIDEVILVYDYGA